MPPANATSRSGRRGWRNTTNFWWCEPARGAASPAAALTSFSVALQHRLDRILAPPAPLPGGLRAFVRLAALALVAVPVAAILLG